VTGTEELNKTMNNSEKTVGVLGGIEVSVRRVATELTCPVKSNDDSSRSQFEGLMSKLLRYFFNDLFSYWGKCDP